MIEVNRESLAWAAGLFEGEGCISIQKNGYGPRASLSMVDEDTVQKFEAQAEQPVFYAHKDEF